MRFRALVPLAALLIASAPATVPAADIPTSGALPHGGSYVIYSDTTLAATAIDLWFRAPGAGYDNATPGLSRVAATAAAAATLESGTSLVKLVRSLGGRMAIDVYPDIVGVSASVPATAARRVIAAMSAAYFAPAIDDKALRIAQQDAAVLSVQGRYSSDDLLHNELFAQIFASGPAHYAPIPAAADSVKAIAGVTLAQVNAFAKRAFRSANATLTMAGNVDASSLDAVAAGQSGEPDAPFDSTLATPPAPSTSITGNVSGVGIAWTGPPIRDSRAATALDFVADYLFRDETGVVAKTLAPSGETYVSGQFITLHDPGVMLVTIGGDAAAATQARVLAAVAGLAKPLDPAAFASAKEAFLYHLASDTQTPVSQADNLGWYSAEGNAAYAPSDTHSEYWAIARALDPEFVASVVREYLAHPVVVQLTATPSKEPAS